MIRILVILLIFCLLACNSNPRNNVEVTRFDSQNHFSTKTQKLDTNIVIEKVRKSDSISEIFNYLIEIIGDVGLSYTSQNNEFYLTNGYYDQKYSLIFNNLSCFDRISNCPRKTELYLQLYNFSKYYGLDTISRYLATTSKVDELSLYKNKLIEVDTSDWRNFSGDIAITIKGQVLGNTFENINLNKINDRTEVRFTVGLERFRVLEYKESRFFMNDTMLAIMPNYGFEEVKSVITVWKVNGKKYELICILDRWLREAIGMYWIEHVIKIDESRKLLIGRSGGGDEGVSWGNLWIAVWEFPRKFSMVYTLSLYSDSYDNPQDESIEYSLSKDNKMIFINNIQKKYKVEKGNWYLLDSTKVIINLRIDSLVANKNN